VKTNYNMADIDAIAVTKFGEPAKLVRRPVPKPGPGEVQLKVIAVGRNVFDPQLLTLTLMPSQ
jgi:NADPH:quinone reductase-like Zn-dependent oxidoreductase